MLALSRAERAISSTPCSPACATITQAEPTCTCCASSRRADVAEPFLVGRKLQLRRSSRAAPRRAPAPRSPAPSPQHEQQHLALGLEMHLGPALLPPVDGASPSSAARPRARLPSSRRPPIVTPWMLNFMERRLSAAASTSPTATPTPSAAPSPSPAPSMAPNTTSPARSESFHVISWVREYSVSPVGTSCSHITPGKPSARHVSLKLHRRTLNQTMTSGRPRSTTRVAGHPCFTRRTSP